MYFNYPIKNKVKFNQFMSPKLRENLKALCLLSNRKWRNIDE